MKMKDLAVIICVLWIGAMLAFGITLQIIADKLDMIIVLLQSMQ